MKYLLIAFLGCLLAGRAWGQDADSVWIKRHYIKQERTIPMRDGIKLFTVIYRALPDGKKHPILFFRTAYSCATYGREWLPFWKSYWKQYLRKGYCMVLQDVRGRFESEGNFVNIRPFNPHKKDKKDIDEASDAYDSIDWLVKNIPGNNGRVGVMGVSYSGFYTVMAALCEHPALRAVSPQAPVTDWYRGDDLHHNGAFFLQDAFSFYVQDGFGLPRHRLQMAQGPGIGQPREDAYGWFLRHGPLHAFTRLAGDSIAFWKDLMAHPDEDGWWRARNDLQYLHLVPKSLPVLVTGGLFDAEDSYGTWAVYRALVKADRNHIHLAIGPWYHGGWSGGKGDRLAAIGFGSNTGEWYTEHIEIPFFDRYLLGEGRDTLAPVRVFFTGENRWHHFRHWPAAGHQQVLYLSGGKNLSFSRPKKAGCDSYISDPTHPVPYLPGILHERTKDYLIADQRFAAQRKDVLCYLGDTLRKPLTVAGAVTPDLWLKITGTDADIVVKLIDVFPGGYQMPVRMDIFRGKYRHSFSKPSPFVPGQPAHIRFSMTDIAHTFLPGHRLMVQVQSSWFPLADCNPQRFENIYQAKTADFMKEKITVLYGGRYPSCLRLGMTTGRF